MKTRTLFMLMAVAMVSTACSEVSGLVDDLVNPATASVSLQATTFSPAAANVRVGGTVTWTNAGPVQHTVTPTNAGQAGAWPARTIPAQQGATFSHTFTTAGTFSYFCTIHEGMNGVIHVE